MPGRKRARKKRGSSTAIPGGSRILYGGSSHIPAGSMSVGGSMSVPGGRLTHRSIRHRSIPASQGKLRAVHQKGSRYKHGAHFLGGSLSSKDSHRVFGGAQNTFYPALDRSRIRDINYRGVKHAAYRGSTI